MYLIFLDKGEDLMAELGGMGSNILHLRDA